MAKTWASVNSPTFDRLDPHAQARVEANIMRRRDRRDSELDSTVKYRSRLHPDLDLFTDEELRPEALAGDKDALEALFDRHSGLIAYIAQRIYRTLTAVQRKSIDPDDVYQVVAERALKSIGNRPKADFKAVAFGYGYQAGLHHTRKESGTVRIPPEIDARLKKIRAINNATKHEMSLDEIANLLKIPARTNGNFDQITAENLVCAMRLQAMGSLNTGFSSGAYDVYGADFGFDEGSNLTSMTMSEDESVEELFDRVESRELVWGVMQQLDEKWRELLIERFGMRDNKPKTLEEVGEGLEHPISGVRVRQIISKALRDFRYSETPEAKSLRSAHSDAPEFGL